MKLILLTFTFLLISLFSSAQEKGKAAFYGTKFDNKMTASGEMYRKDSMVCAHKTYPFGTRLKVKNTENNKEVIVKVIDRGPFGENCIVDLSHAAAKELDMVKSGIINVEVSRYIDSLKLPAIVKCLRRM
ncbi:septal ring lytic transglycosylase RlpA family protein [Prevotella sp. 10(H)]|uniref:septal ring lytic transglycosylase RlpA family protein n=1 Tax=Prevotella sp. 10(H) TaxID=1158294 RepID=UPI000689F8D7|nr:septal ring lytic transglycosylase RlpA family protein [Prevotella sp. 10(H)]